MVVVDSHQHFWNPAELPLGLPSPAAEIAVFTRAYLPADLQPEIESVGVDYTVIVQAPPQDDTCNRWMFSRANETPFVAGVVAWADLMDPAAIGSALDELQKEPKFAGIRHIVENEPGVDWILQRPVIESLGELARRGVTYDMVAKPSHLANVLKVMEAVPNLRMVVDHIAKPNIAAGGFRLRGRRSPATADEGASGWSEHLAAIAEYPQVYCKLSGMITEADWANWKPSDLAPYVHRVIGLFGWERVMFGSDWPVCLLAGTYRRVWDAINEILAGIDESQRARVFGANAVKFYGLKLGGAA